MITIDIKNAFGSIHKGDLIELLIHFSVPYKIINFIDSYLSNRKFIVMENDYVENNIGVPQGSSLGPILWLIIINVLLDKCNSDDFDIIVYADDVTILLNATACYHFTELTVKPLALIEQWCNNFKLKCSTSKC